VFVDANFSTSDEPVGDSDQRQSVTAVGGGGGGAANSTHPKTSPSPAVQPTTFGIEVLNGSRDGVGWKYPSADSYVNVLFVAPLGAVVGGLNTAQEAVGGLQWTAEAVAHNNVGSGSTGDAQNPNPPRSPAVPEDWRKARSTQLQPSAARLAESHLRIIDRAPTDFVLHCYEEEGTGSVAGSDSAESKAADETSAPRKIRQENLVLLRAHVSTLSRASACVIQGVVAAADRYAHAYTQSKSQVQGSAEQEEVVLRDDVASTIQEYVEKDICLWSLRMHKDGVLTALRAMEACIPSLRFMQFSEPRGGKKTHENGSLRPKDSGRGSHTLLPSAILNRRILPVDLPHHLYVIGAMLPTTSRGNSSKHHAAVTRRNSCFVAGRGVDVSSCRPLRERIGLALDDKAHRLNAEGHVCFDDGRPVLSKIVDFGNACWVTEHFTDDIQTRQYRAPEVIIGAGYDTAADIWSYACLVFELLTGELLFDPRTRPNATYSRNEDHIALMVEMMGDFDRKFVLTGKHYKEFFNKRGVLRPARPLLPCNLATILAKKFGFPTQEADVIADFLEKSLALTPAKRWSAQQLLDHPWFKGVRNGSLT